MKLHSAASSASEPARYRSGSEISCTGSGPDAAAGSGLTGPGAIEPGGGGTGTQPCGGGGRKVGGMCGSRVGTTTEVPQRAQNRAPLATGSPQEIQNMLTTPIRMSYRILAHDLYVASVQGPSGE